MGPVVSNKISNTKVMKNLQVKVALSKAFHAIVLNAIADDTLIHYIDSVVYLGGKLIVFTTSSAVYFSVKQYTETILRCCDNARHLPKVTSVTIKVRVNHATTVVTQKEQRCIPKALSVALDTLAKKVKSPKLQASLALSLIHI